MKLFASILLCYVILLTAFPCVDTVSDKPLQEMAVSENSTDHHSHDCDMCSPFCTCNCCVSPIIISSFITQVDGYWFTQKYFIGYQPSYYSSPYISFWQPPKIA